MLREILVISAVVDSMNRKLTKYKNILLAIVLVVVVLLPSKLVWAEDYGGYGLNTTMGQGIDLPKDKSVPQIIGMIIGIALSFIGAIFFILIIYSGFLWMTARGNETEVTKAKDMIIASIIGLIIVLSAYAITKYVGTAFGL